jgi:hypothetical protein
VLTGEHHVRQFAYYEKLGRGFIPTSSGSSLIELPDTGRVLDVRLNARQHLLQKSRIFGS